MTKEEINIIARWMSEVWKCYCKYMQVEMNQWDFDRLRDELDRIWEESGQNELILNMGVAISNDIERRQLNASKECCNT